MLSFRRVHQCRTPPDDGAIRGAPTRSDLDLVDDGPGGVLVVARATTPTAPVSGPAERQPDLAPVADGRGGDGSGRRATDVDRRGQALPCHQLVVAVQGGADL